MTENRWWYCKDCHAVNDGLETSTCWNCGRVHRKSKNFPWCEMREKKCDVCKKKYVVWVLPPDSYLKGEEYELGLCMDYFKHYGDNAYYPPMLPLEYILEGNNWSVNQAGKVVRNR